MTLLTVAQAELAFNEAWNHPQYTQIQLDDVDINQALELKKINVTSTFTRQHLWQAEVKKAYRPDVYISNVVIKAKFWGETKESSTAQTFVRSSWQKQWLNANLYKEVFEQVFINHKSQCVTFLGTSFLADENGQVQVALNDQPLFHVQHAVEGKSDQPKNVWRIVHLTKQKDQQLIEVFKKLNDSTKLPMFVQTYLKKDCQINLPSV